MGSDWRSGARVALRGAPDGYLGEKQIPSCSRRTPVMQVEMTQDVIDEMLQNIREGRPPTIHFGQNPILKIGETKIVLDATKEKFRNELYETVDTNAQDDNTDLASSYFSMVDYRLALQRATEASRAMNRTDTALETLKSNMEAIRKEKTAPKVSMDVNTLRLNELDKRKRLQQGKYGRASHGAVLGGRLVAPNSNASSPALSAASPRPTAPTSAPVSSNTSKMEWALRKALIHMLAVKPVKLQDLARKMRIPKEDISPILGKIAKEQGGEWKLTDKAYKELDPFSRNIRFWTEEERETARQNAIRALDRQRLDPLDKTWQKLLPEHDRGKGITLSKLSLSASSTAQKSSTPVVKPVTNKQRLSQLTKKPEARKKEPRKKKSEEDAFGIVSQKKVKSSVDENTAASGQKKLLKRADGEEKDVKVTKRKQEKVSSEEDMGRATLQKAAKRPIAGDQAGQSPHKKIKRSTPDDGEAATQVMKRKAQKTSSEASKDAHALGQQKTARASKEGTAKSGTTAVTAKLNKETAQGGKLTIKKQLHTTSAVGSTNNAASTTTASKKAALKTNEQKASDHTVGKSFQPKINGLSFTSTKKAADVMSSTNPFSAGSPLTTSDVEKTRPPHKPSANVAGVATPGNSDRTLKRKANDIDSDIHKHDVNVKHRKTIGHTPLPNNTSATATPPSSDRSSLKHKADGTMSDSKAPAARKPAASYKASKPTQTPTPSYSGASSISSTSSTQSHQPSAGHGHHHDSPQSFHDASSASPEQGQPLNVRRAIELSTQFKRCYAKYHALYTSISNRRDKPPTEQEREEIRKQEGILSSMKREVKRLMANPEG